MKSLDALIAGITAWANQDPELDYRDAALLLVKRILGGDESAMEIARDLFGSRLTFGTAGIRGPMRLGPNGMNRMVISQTTTGVARFLQQRSEVADVRIPHVVIGFDGRHHSEQFAQDTAEILSGHGIRAALLPRMLPTPVLAFAVRAIGTDAGIMITASHNPSEDNGYKVYLGDRDEGSQIISPVDQEIEAHIQKVADSDTWATIPRSTRLVSFVDERIVQEYISATLDNLKLPIQKSPGPRVVYSSMHGVGGKTFLAAARHAGFSDSFIVEEQFHPNPYFPTVKSPNPETDGALDLSFAKAREVCADIIIAHDPDADRLAVALPDSSSPHGYSALTGNQVGAVFGWFLSKKARESDKTGTLANSLVSSPVLGKIARHFGHNHEETLTGFKYVSRVQALLFGFEEALGYLVTPAVVRDKDGISAALLMLSLAGTLAGEGRTLWCYLREIQETVGSFASGQLTISLTSRSAGPAVTSALRDQQLEEIGSASVNHRDDFLEGVRGFPREDILRYFLDDGTRIIFRPSGTEPKIKIYVDTEGATMAEAQNRLTEAETSLRLLTQSY